MFKKILKKISSLKSLYQAYTDPETVFIYQMGKVGSSSLEHSIPNAYHVHAFYDHNHPCPIRQHGLAQHGLQYFYNRLRQKLHLALLRMAFRRRKQTKIITLIREPVARNVSMFFHDLDAYLFEIYSNSLNSQTKPLLTRFAGKEVVQKAFVDVFDHDYPLRWFDHEFKAMTGIDIFMTPFDADAGVSFITSGSIEVLCLRTDKLNTNANKVAEFIGQPFELNTINVADSKWYSTLYRDFKNDFEIPRPLVDKLLSSKLARHFFTTDELNQLNHKYIKQS